VVIAKNKEYLEKLVRIRGDEVDPETGGNPRPDTGDFLNLVWKTNIKVTVPVDWKEIKFGNPDDDMKKF